MKTSYMFFDCFSGSTPRPVVALACGSQSIISNFSLLFKRQPAMLRHEVVFPVPPL